MESIFLVGAGKHCHSCIDVIEQEKKYNIIGLLDSEDRISDNILGYKVIASDDDLPYLIQDCKNALITVGQIRDATLRERLFNTLLDIGYSLPVIASPHAYIAKTAEIGAGTIIMHHAVVNVNVKIGSNCIINSKALVEHDAYIGSHTHISTGAIVNGSAKIMNNVFIGSNSTICETTTVSEYSFIKAGSLYKGKII